MEADAACRPSLMGSVLLNAKAARCAVNDRPCTAREIQGFLWQVGAADRIRAKRL